MASRPLVTVQSPNLHKASTATLPFVLTAPIRDDIVQSVHTRMNKNHRQPYAVSRVAGAQTSAQSWGTGRAVSRIPRVPGGGTHRSGQAAFGNMCRGGRMFAPNKIWRRWHIKISKGQRRFATVSALAASAVAPLVMARGHRVEKLAEVPLVVADVELDTIAKTKEAVKLLQSVGAYEDIKRVQDSKHLRVGKGKARNRRYVQKKGPLIIHNKNTEADKAAPQLVAAFRNIPGVELCHVSRLNLLQLAPGGHVGRFILWTESAFKELDNLFGTATDDSKQKLGYRPPRPLLNNADIHRIINSDEVQSHLRASKKQSKLVSRKKNPLKNFGFLVKLNPYAPTQRRRALVLSQKKHKKPVHKAPAKPKGAVEKPKVSQNKQKKARLNRFLTVFNTPSVAPKRSDIEKGVV
jgi:large subunit ribosomal protein L4e